MWPMTGVGFGVLGPLQMSVDGTLVPLGTPKQRAVLAMLVINRNRPVGHVCHAYTHLPDEYGLHQSFYRTGS